MTVHQIDELGPVDWLVVEFPGSKFRGEIAPALDDLVERGIVRVLDLLILKKDTDGSLEAFELSDLDESEIGQLRGPQPTTAAIVDDYAKAQLGSLKVGLLTAALLALLALMSTRQLPHDPPAGRRKKEEDPQRSPSSA